jgi:hypothetical protein
MTRWTSSAWIIVTLVMGFAPARWVDGDALVREGDRSTAGQAVAQSSGSSDTHTGGGQPHSHGPGTKPHTHAVSQEDILRRALVERDRLIREEKVDPSWKTVETPLLQRKEFKGRNEWVATFEHPAPPEKGKEKLYIFLTLGGRFVAANYTGR